MNTNLTLKIREIEKIREKIIETKKELVLLRIKKITKQENQSHIIKNKRQQLSRLLTLETQYLIKEKNNNE
uniref:Large ribosomal subunit protein uL29c n=1 Tax=Spyridia filamentosa TaxID=196632 RepID=A0A1Z1MJZ6_SPYFI|nr:ribosomal protein L29 [Spyridia filamentosa]ARW66256.1 ribosomal protein L29 [Spyridia filamentosa]